MRGEEEEEEEEEEEDEQDQEEKQDQEQEQDQEEEDYTILYHTALHYTMLTPKSIGLSLDRILLLFNPRSDATNDNYCKPCL